MILRNLPLLFRDPEQFFLVVLFTLAALLVGITVHEFSHALVADRLGDTTPRRLGRLSFNPLVHLDPLGTIMLLLAGFGWGKPVPVNPFAFGRRAFRDMALVAFAGPLSNITVAALVALPFKLDILPWPFPFIVARAVHTPWEVSLALFLFFLLFYNLVLALFNLIPLAPLDGSKVVQGVVPRPWAEALHRLEPMGPAILLTIIASDFILGIGILSRTLGPAINALAQAFAGHRIF